MSKSLRFTLKDILKSYGVGIIVCIILAIINVFTTDTLVNMQDASEVLTSNVTVNGVPVNSAFLIFKVIAIFGFTWSVIFIYPWIIGFTGPYDRFETHIRLGNTRKSYIVSEIVVDVLNIVIIQIMLLIVYNFFASFMESDTFFVEGLNALKRGVHDYRVILVYLGYAMTARWLGALTYRFGGKLWLTLLVVAVLSNILIAWLFNVRLNISETMGQIIAWVYVAAAIGVTIVSMLKQDVRGNK